MDFYGKIFSKHRGEVRIKIKRVNESTIEECTQIWNEAFSIYPVNIKMTPIEFQNRMINKELDSEKSVIAFDNNKPIGFILNSIKMIEGKICAWNGGTGVSPKYKGRGIGALLMNAAEEIYKENRVEFATLEVLKENIPAMKLYEKFGYSFNNSLITYEIKNSLQDEDTHNRQYSIEKGQSQDVKELSFYNKNVPWDAMYQNIMQGKSINIRDEQGLVVGYALYQLVEKENKNEFYLYQCEVLHSYQNKYDIVNKLLKAVFNSTNDNNLFFVPELFTSVYNALDMIGNRTAERFLMDKKY